MQIYLVGGTVRDQLLKLPVTERDWVVVGSTPAELKQLGYQQVGKDFPVFLHPQTKEEYALARTERKSGRGYTGFICDFTPTITLEQDLQRRDLTINAIAQDTNGQLIDPFGGVNDLNDRLLRHVSDAFSEDPLRVLRVARFAARFHHLGFSIAPETMQLMQQMSQAGELNTLTPERVWRETHKALQSNSPDIYFTELRRCGALAILMPELNNLFGVPAPAQWHPEIDSGVHTLLALQQITQLTTSPSIRFAVACHDLGKGVTPKALWPHHQGHGEAGLTLIKTLCQRLKIPNHYRDCALRVCRFHDMVHKVLSLSATQILALLDGIDVWRNPEHLNELILASEADYRGRRGWQNKAYPQAEQLTLLYQQAKSIAVQPIIAQGFQGAEIKQQLDQQRLAKIEATLAQLQAAQ